MTTKNTCTACGRDMFRQWAGAKFGGKKLCLTCHRLGFRFTASGDLDNKFLSVEKALEVVRS